MPLLRTIGGRLRSFRMINRAVMHHGRRIAEILDDRVNSLLPDSLKIDFWLFMLAIVDLLRLRHDRLTGAEHVLVAERANDPRHRNERDQSTDNLRFKVQHFRDAFETHYLPDSVEEFGFPLVLAGIPFEVLRQADHLVEMFTRPNFVVPEPQIGTGLPIADLVAEIATMADGLRSSLDATDREVKLEEFALVDKDEAAADWDQLSGWAVRTITGLFTLAGKPELAARVLPSVPRRGQRGVVDGEGGAGGEEGDDSEPPGNEEPASEPSTGEPSGESGSGSEQPRPDPAA